MMANFTVNPALFPSRSTNAHACTCTCMYMYLHVHDASIATHAVAIDCSILLCIQVHTRTNSYTRTREIVSKCRARAFIHVMKLQRSKVVATFLSLAACLCTGHTHPPSTREIFNKFSRPLSVKQRYMYRMWS